MGDQCFGDVSGERAIFRSVTEENLLRSLLVDFHRRLVVLFLNARAGSLGNTQCVAYLGNESFRAFNVYLHFFKRGGSYDDGRKLARVRISDPRDAFAELIDDLLQDLRHKLVVESRRIEGLAVEFKSDHRDSIGSVAGDSH